MNVTGSGHSLVGALWRLDRASITAASNLILKETRPDACCKLLLSWPSLRGQTSFRAPKLWAEIVRHGPRFAGISSVQLFSFVSRFLNAEYLVIEAPVIVNGPRTDGTLFGLICSLIFIETLFLQIEGY
jgi:hypothetical protein